MILYLKSKRRRILKIAETVSKCSIMKKRNSLAPGSEIASRADIIGKRTNGGNADPPTAPPPDPAATADIDPTNGTDGHDEEISTTTTTTENCQEEVNAFLATPVAADFDGAEQQLYEYKYDSELCKRCIDADGKNPINEVVWIPEDCPCKPEDIAGYRE
ncbi:hypothetical protein ABW19_dt0204895 [Dactylella cylindrospora]|nr:hypothetical protein ABW19_dt0204895 [Dactylella cylindrospora]